MKILGTACFVFAVFILSVCMLWAIFTMIDKKKENSFYKDKGI